jgi:hypothetical protein
MFFIRFEFDLIKIRHDFPFFSLRTWIDESAVHPKSQNHKKYFAKFLLILFLHHNIENKKMNRSVCIFTNFKYQLGLSYKFAVCAFRVNIILFYTKTICFFFLLNYFSPDRFIDRTTPVKGKVFAVRLLSYEQIKKKKLVVFNFAFK